MDTVFTFTLESEPKPYSRVKYYGNDELSLDVGYNKKSWNPKYEIENIDISKPLSSDTIVPRAVGAAGPRGLIQNKTLQISFNNINFDGNCGNNYGLRQLPEISMGETATFQVNGLVDDGSVNLRIDSCSLTVNGKTFTITPTGYVDNRITHARCDISTSGGRRSKSRTKKVRRNRRRSKRTKN